ncbi:hypothetical protein [Cryptosporangium sp. NPDC051539]|uniref:hypothetical protein n=1 Tax=Cryptosporangium sp. NPDC051539 TaxID=3363962 RepID=UPI003791686B
MIEIGSRARRQPPPPRVVFEALIQPDRDPARPWLNLRDGERRPRVIESDEPSLVVWSTLWPTLPGAQIRFELSAHEHETLLRWTLLTPAPLDDPGLVGALRKRMNVMVNAHLRSTFGQ